MQLNLIEARKKARSFVFFTLVRSLSICVTLIRPVGHLINGPKCVAKQQARAIKTNLLQLHIQFQHFSRFFAAHFQSFPCGFCSCCSFSKHFFTFFFVIAFVFYFSLLLSVFDKVFHLFCLFILFAHFAIIHAYQLFIMCLIYGLLSLCFALSRTLCLSLSLFSCPFRRL